MNANHAWTAQEVEAAVSDYMHMLTLELTGQSYNKTAHRHALQLKLRDRSEGPSSENTKTSAQS